MTLQISLCIPTMNRWEFLKINLPKYLQNPYIGEIIITDETGEDFEILTKVYKDNSKIKVFKNNKRLGGFLNKLQCMKYASYDWICLLDSDNYADLSYFNEFFLYTRQNKLQQNMIYCPSFAKPYFNFQLLENIIVDEKSIKGILNSENQLLLERSFNTGNYIINRSVVNILESIIMRDKEVDEISKLFFPMDAFYMNYLLLQNGYSFVIVPNMEYEHIVHDGSFYVTHGYKYDFVEKYIYQKFRTHYK